MKPEEFYPEGDLPAADERNRMWNNIRSGISSRRALPGTFDKRSFFYGAAVAVVLLFAGIGVYDVVKSAVERTQPAEITIDRAYRNAIREFETIVPNVISQKERETGKYLSNKQQLELIDEAIAGLRTQTGSNDLSPLVRDRLKTLYSMKLQVLQRMIEEGEVQL